MFNMSPSPFMFYIKIFQNLLLVFAAFHHCDTENLLKDISKSLIPLQQILRHGVSETPLLRTHFWNLVTADTNPLALTFGCQCIVS